MWKGTYMCKHLSVNISLVGVCNVCVLFVSTGWLSGVDRDPEQPAQMGNTQCSLYASDLLPWGYRAVMVLRVVCGLFGKLQKLLNERGGDLLFYRTRLWLHSCCRYSSNRDKGSWTHQKIATKKLHSLKKVNFYRVSWSSSLSGVGPESQHINLHWRARTSSRTEDNTSELQFRAVCVKELTFHRNTQGQHQKRT